MILFSGEHGKGGRLFTLLTGGGLPQDAIGLGDDVDGKWFAVVVGHEHGDHDVFALVGPSIGGFREVGVKVTFVNTHSIVPRHVGVRKTFHGYGRFSFVVVRHDLGRRLLVPVVTVKLNVHRVRPASPMMEEFGRLASKHGSGDDVQRHL